MFLLSYLISCALAEDSEGMGYMRFSSEQLKEMWEAYQKAPIAYIDPDIEKELTEPPFEGAHFDLLSHLNYVPTDRNQGSCGNCWVWSGTGIVEVALDVEEGIFDRLSIQYFDSCWSGWACCGGRLWKYGDWTEAQGYVVPWSNTNAHFQDGVRTCGDGSSLVACGSVATAPQYGVIKCDHSVIPTTSIDKATAIANIKNILHQNRAVEFGFFLSDFDIFRNHWKHSLETDIWTPPSGLIGDWGAGSGGHATLCIGYDDTNPDNPYWIVVNSWGTYGGARPNGIFRLDMNMDYEAYFYDPGDGKYYYSYSFETLDVDFDIPEPEPVGGVYSIANKLQLVYSWVGLWGVILVVVIAAIQAYTNLYPSYKHAMMYEGC
jgi:hypothetical protein